MRLWSAAPSAGLMAAAALLLLSACAGGPGRPAPPAAGASKTIAAVAGGAGTHAPAPGGASGTTASTAPGGAPGTKAAAPGGPGTSAAAAGVIPWADVPGTPLSTAASTSAARPCAAADLDIVAGRAGAFRGQATQELDARDRSADACFLAGVPQGLVPNAGARSRVSSGEFAAQRVDLVPGSSAIVLIGTPTACAASGQPIVGSSVQLTLPNGDAVTVSGTRIDTECGAPAVVAFEPVSPPDAAAGPLGMLNVSIAAPPTVARGTVLTYRVTLTNPSATSTTLSPCPSYSQVLGMGGGAPAQQTLLLNCPAAASMATNAAVTYEMRLAVPASTPTGLTKLSWRLEVPGGPVAGAEVSVT
jgi:hypothetical protein